MKKVFIIIFACIISSFCIAQDKCDSISFYSNGKISYLKTKKPSGYSIYKWYSNGHIQSRITKENYEFYRTENYKDGSLKFDTASNHNMSFCEYFYKDGTLQRRILEYKEGSSSFKTEPPYAHYEFDSVGNVSLIVKKDITGKIVVNESYPFEKYRNIKKCVVYYPNGNIMHYGTYNLSKTGDTLKTGGWFDYYKNGQIANAGLYINNIPWGLHLIYDSLGIIVKRQYFINGSLTNEFDSKFTKNQSFIIGRYNDRDGIDSAMGRYDNNKRNYYNYYYYKGLQICEVPESKRIKDSSSLISFVFPLFEFFSGYDYFTSNYYKPINFYQETEMICGQVANNWEYNGKTKIAAHNVANNKSIHNTAFSRIRLKWREYIDSTGHLFVTLPCGSRIELIDRQVAINGYWEFIASNGIKIFEGNYNNGQNGKWIEYYPQNGNRYIVQNIDYHQHAKGIYKEYYRNGKLKVRGKFNDNNNKTGIWKEFTDRGQKVGRARFINDKKYGIVISENSIKKNGRSSKIRVLYWNGNKLFKSKKKKWPIENF